MRQQVIDSWSHRSPTERATTWLLPAGNHIPAWIKGNHAKVAVRVTTHTPYVLHCAMPLTVLLSRPVPILQEKTLPAPFRKPANIFPAR